MRKITTAQAKVLRTLYHVAYEDGSLSVWSIDTDNVRVICNGRRIIWRGYSMVNEFYLTEEDAQSYIHKEFNRNKTIMITV